MYIPFQIDDGRIIKTDFIELPINAPAEYQSRSGKDTDIFRIRCQSVFYPITS